MNKFYKTFIPLCLLVLLTLPGISQVGVYDPSFGTSGKIFQLFNNVDVEPNAIVLQADGKIVIGGSGEDFFNSDTKIIRLNGNGSLDASFGINGIFTSPLTSDMNYLQSLLLQPDGKILAGGIIQTLDPITQQTNADFHLYRLNADGNFDSTFGTNGNVVTDIAQLSEDAIHKIILKADGKIIAGGYLMDTNTGDEFYALAQYNVNGTLDSTFGTNGKSVIPLNQQPEGKGSIALLPNGKIMVATTVVNPTTSFYEFGLVRFNANGSIDASFGTAGVVQLSLNYFHSVLSDMAIQADGKIVLTGDTPLNNGDAIAVVRVDSEGAYDPTFGVNGVVRTHISPNPFDPDAGMTIAIQPDNKIIVGATLYNSINSYDANFAVVRYLPDGRIDRDYGRQGVIITDFDENGDFAKASVQQPDGKFILVGAARTLNGEVGFGIVRYLSDARFYYNTVKGSVFYDNNSNGIKETGEDFLGNATVIAEKTGIDTLSFTASTGKFSVEVDTGIYVFRPVQPYYTAVPASKIISHPTYFNTDSISFAMQPIPGKRDLFVYIIPLNPSRPGFETDYMIMYGNNGTDTVASGSVNFVPSQFVNVLSSNPAPAVTIGDTMRWNYVNLYPHDTAFIFINGRIDAPPIVNIGDTLVSFASILPTGLDEEPKDNSFVLREDVIGSYDPNDKNESHAGQISPAQVTAGEYLQYIIRFQNTGTDTAFNIYIRDTLQSTLDWNSMEMVAASHSYKLAIDNGICLWTFNDIKLVDSNRNEPASHGYIVYRIKPKATLVPGDIITNKASIYFDYNLPVVTNIQTTEIISLPIPLRLLSFTAKKAGRTNLLQWSTTNELNTDRFEIERSINGTAFQKLSNETALPGTTGVNNYSYIDANPLTGRNYYRLKMVDRDGTFTFSPVKLLSNKASDYFTIYPNPVTDILYVKIDREDKGDLQVQLLTGDGKLVGSIAWNVEKGTSVKSVNTSSLTAGSYLLRINESGKEPIVLKFSKK